ncbi:general substrate transporter [Aspergillus pseudoustus]|uniref:General substrate transporter n=1 Tax=Aspergillus pseudoustus TaxID=1810923 RepID=A0ABR4J3F0_9EURO
MLNLDFARGRVLYRLMSLCCCLAFGMYGYDAGVLGGVQETKPFRDAMGNPTGTYIIPMIASSYTLAATVCSLITSVMGMPLGRRGCILLGDILVIVGGSLQASAWSVAQMIVGRVICGFGIGAEMSITTKERGPEVAIQCIFLVGGCAFAYWVDFGFTRMDNQVSWRFPIGFQTAFAIVSAIGMFLLPDTPRWYYARGRYEEGDNILARLHDCDVTDDAVQSMRQSIIVSIEFEEESRKFNVLDLFWDKTKLRVGHRIRVAFLLLSMQQMMGINLSVYYSTVIFGQIGLSAFMSQLLAAVMNTTFAMGSFLLPGTIERFGRRGIMMYSAVGLTICLTVFVAMIGTSNPTPATQWTAVAAAFAYNFIFGYGWIGVVWLYGPEIAPLRYRHVGGAAAAFGEWLFCFITVFAGGIGLQNVGWKMWLWCLLSCALAVPFVYFLCPETTGKTLEEIDILFAKGDVPHEIMGPGSFEGEGKEVLEFEHEDRVKA